MTTEETITALVEPAIEDLGFELVRVKLHGTPRRTLQVMIEPADHTSQMTVESCADISHLLSALLDVDDPIGGSYDLEVSSPGLDRPLVKPQHFERFRGFEARVETREPIEGQRRFRGRLRGLDAGDVLLDLEGAEQRVSFANIKKAKLVLNDELLASARQQHA
ncbi:MAG: ribosome maturation factor RimP [Pseudomonadota bacterium]